MADETTTTQQTTTGTANTQTTDTSPAQQTATTGNAETPIMNEAQLLERLERARKTERERLLKSLGHEDETTASAALKKAKELEDAALSEAEKQAKAVTDAQRERDEAKARIVELEQKAKVKDFKDAIRKAATDAKAKYPDDVYLMVSQEPAFAKWLENDEPDDKAIKARIEGLKKDRPEWFTNGNGSPGSVSNRNAAGNPNPNQTDGERKKLWGL